MHADATISSFVNSPSTGSMMAAKRESGEMLQSQQQVHNWGSLQFV